MGSVFPSVHLADIPATSKRRRIEAAAESSMTLLFALVVAVCAAVLTVLFAVSWYDGDFPATVVLAVALLSVLIVMMVALRVAL